MRTLSKIISPVYCRYEDPMGRPDIGVEPVGKRVFDSAVPLTSSGYDRGGAYWGKGDELRVKYTKDLTFIKFYRKAKEAKITVALEDRFCKAIETIKDPSTINISVDGQKGIYVDTMSRGVEIKKRSKTLIQIYNKNVLVFIGSLDELIDVIENIRDNE